MGATLGLVLLTGGKGERLGGPKHDRAHPAGGTWGGHLVALFRAACPEGPVCILGRALPDHPDLKVYPDPGEGPAVALRLWAAREDVPPAERWWIVPCDQVRWTTEALEAWHAEALKADPDAVRWVMAEAQDRPQPLGGFLPHRLRPALAAVHASTVRRLAEGVGPVTIPWEEAVWRDIDDPEGLRAWTASPG
ncbi:MAG: NTP transferase domain-containing protein [Holophagaceae bacterium]